jgi:hypothetical protein
MPVGSEMDQHGGNPAQDIECDKTRWPEPVFHVVPKNIEKPHVPQQMEPSPMEKHIAEKGEYLLEKGVITG